MGWINRLLVRVGRRRPPPPLPDFDGRYLRMQDGQLLRKRSYHTGTMHRIDFEPVRGGDAAPE